MEFTAHADIRIRARSNGTQEVFDVIRKSWVRYTPEERVRQHVIRFLTGPCGYPASMMSVEREIRLGELRKKFDLLLYDRVHRPWMMVECKAPEVPLTEAVLMQILRYHMAVPAPFLVMTNGHECLAVDIGDGQVHWLEAWPLYP